MDMSIDVLAINPLSAVEPGSLLPSKPVAAGTSPVSKELPISAIISLPGFAQCGCPD